MATYEMAKSDSEILVNYEFLDEDSQSIMNRKINKVIVNKNIRKPIAVVFASFKKVRTRGPITTVTNKPVATRKISLPLRVVRPGFNFDSLAKRGTGLIKLDFGIRNA